MSNQTLYEAMPFEKKVQAMRNAQKEYFRTRSIDWLKSAKMFESLVDKELNEMPINYPKSFQP
jgi:hypothetical protein